MNDKTINCEYQILDIFKMFLAIIVVLRHSVQAFFESNHILYKIIVNSISPIAVPVFFVISGFLFFRKERTNQDLKKQLLRIFKLYMAWTIIYIPILIVSKNRPSLIRFVQNFLFSGTYDHLWYLPSLIVAMSIVFFLKKKIPLKYISLIGIILYIFGTAVDTYKIIEMPLYTKIFLTTRNGLFFGMFFVSIGALLLDIKNYIKTTIGILLFGIIMLTIESIYINESLHSIIVNMNVSSLFIAPSLISLAINYNSKTEDTRKYNKDLRNLSTIVFCSHPIIILVVEKISKYVFINAYFAISIILMVSLISSYICYIISRKIKILKYLY